MKQPAPDKEIIHDIKAGLESPFWKALRTVIQQNIDFLALRIAGDTGEELTDEGRRDFIRLRNLNKGLLEMPERIVAEAEEKPQKQPTFDPYAHAGDKPDLDAV